MNENGVALWLVLGLLLVGWRRPVGQGEHLLAAKIPRIQLRPGVRIRRFKNDMSHLVGTRANREHSAIG